MSKIKDPLPDSLLSSASKDYAQIRSLLQDPSSLSATEVFELNTVRNQIKQIIDKVSSSSEGSDHAHAIAGALWVAHAHLDNISEEFSEQESSLRKAFKEFETLKSQEELVALQIIEGLNQLGLLWIQRASYAEGKRHLEAAINIYKEFALRPEDVHSLESLLEPKREISAKKALNNAHLCTVCALANANQKLGLNEEAIESCVYALDKELELGDFRAEAWIGRALDILSTLRSKSMYLTAKKYLAIAFTFLRKEDGEKMGEEERVRLLARAQVHWGQLCAAVLDRGEDSGDKEVSLPSHIPLDSDIMSTPIQALSSLKEAQGVYALGQKALEKAAEYYTLNDHCLDYIRITQIHVAMMHSLIKIEGTSPKEAFRLHRRQLEAMDAILKVLNPTHYMEESRALWTESFRILESMLELRGADKQRNVLVSLAVRHLSQYVESFSLNAITDPREGLAVLVGYMDLGKLHGKYVSPLDGAQALQRQIECYQVIKKFCNENPESPVVTGNKEAIKELLDFIDYFFALNLRRK